MPSKEADMQAIIAGPTGLLLDSVMTPYIEKLRELTNNNAGLAIGVTQGDSVVYARTFGYENIEREQKADFNTLFHIASVSKPFTAFAAVTLVQQGKLHLDDKIVDLIPEFHMQGSGFEEITIEHILTHTSGIPRHVSANDWLNPKSLDVNLEFAKDFELDFEPGSQFNYSNSAFDILGIVISRVSGMPFNDYVTEQVLVPAGMTNSIYNKPIDSLPNNWAAPYSFGLQTQEWTPYPHADNYAPSSGLQTTLPDMCKWALLHLNRGSYGKNPVLDEQHYQLLTSPHFDTPWDEKIGLSWFLQSYLDRPIIMHTGEDTGFESIVYIYPEQDISIVVMANRDFSRVGRMINAVSECLFGQTPQDYSVSAKYKFADVYNGHGIDEAKRVFESMRNDTTDMYFVDNDDILSIGAILENGQKWKETKEVLEYFNSLDSNSTYAWRLLGNANLNLQDTVSAISCYEQTLKINPNYEKGKLALDVLLPSADEQ